MERWKDGQMENLFIMELNEGEDFQKLAWNYNDEAGFFRVCNLNESPEDAIIGRDLFDAEDFIDAVRFGMDLRENGYTGIHVIRSMRRE